MRRTLPFNGYYVATNLLVYRWVNLEKIKEEIGFKLFDGEA